MVYGMPREAVMVSAWIRYCRCLRSQLAFDSAKAAAISACASREGAQAADAAGPPAWSTVCRARLSWSVRWIRYCRYLRSQLAFDFAEGGRDLGLCFQGRRRERQTRRTTCVVYGMPREAVMVGAVDQVLPLSKIAASL